MKLTIVAAIATNNAIGKDNKLLWHLPNDLKFFKNYTLGKVIVMGRKTFESIGRALPGRINVVISRSSFTKYENVLVFKSMDAVLKHFKNSEEVCIVGGAQIYNEALPIADKLVLTRVDNTPQADVFFPEIDFKLWEIIFEEKCLSDERHLFDYTFQVFEKKS